MRPSSTSGRVVYDLDAHCHVAAFNLGRLPLEFDHGSGASIAELVAGREPAGFHQKPLAVFGADEAVLLRWVEPKHDAAQVGAHAPV